MKLFAVLAALAAFFVLAIGGNAATVSLPCGSSLDAAYDAAAPGDLIELSACSYTGKTLTGSKAAPGVIFDLNGGDQGSAGIYATNVEFRDGSLNYYWAYDGTPPQNVTLRNIKTPSFWMNCGSNIQVLGGEIGPESDDSINYVFCDRGGQIADVLFDGVYVHDNDCSSAGCHFEAIRIDRDAVRVTIRNSVFRRNAIFHVFLTVSGGQPPRDVTFERNCFDQPDGGSSVIALHDPILTSMDPADLRVRVRDNFAESGSNFRGPFYEFSGNTFGAESTCDTWLGSPPPPPPPPPPAAECADGLDNDGDGLIDLADPGCVDAADNDETDAPPPPPPPPPPPVDSVAPSAPGDLHVENGTRTSLTLVWAASSDNVGVSGYRVYRDGSLIATVTSLSRNQSNLRCSSSKSSYAYGVEAFDAAGNVSPRSGYVAVCAYR